MEVLGAATDIASRVFRQYRSSSIRVIGVFGVFSRGEGLCRSNSGPEIRRGMGLLDDLFNMASSIALLYCEIGASARMHLEETPSLL